MFHWQGGRRGRELIEAPSGRTYMRSFGQVLRPDGAACFSRTGNHLPHGPTDTRSWPARSAVLLSNTLLLADDHQNKPAPGSTEGPTIIKAGTKRS